jgi:Putative peptidoglycan binding domain
MADQVLLLVLGFVLTTVVGGVLGYYFQRRTWDSNRRESERSAAAAVFDDISRRMDERLYRMRLVYWSLKAGEDDRIEAGMGEYRATLATWNDNLNRNLALAQRYFGRDVWAALNEVIYEEFATIGRHLEGWYRHRSDEDGVSAEKASLSVTGRRLRALGNDIFNLNRFMIEMIQRGTVGLYLEPADDGKPQSWFGDLSVGARSTHVADWQRKLIRLGYGELEVDGWFGQATHAATAAFQTATGLEPDGIVGARTRRAMDEALAATTRPEPET